MPTTTRTNRTGLRVIDDPEYNLLPGKASLDDFPLAPPHFKPQRNGEILDDGEPITRLGERMRDAYASANDLDPSAVPDGLVRMVEALSGDDAANERTLTAVRPLRNRLGTVLVVPFVFLTPLVFPWLINGRAHQRMAKLIRGEQMKLLTAPRDQGLLGLPAIDVDSVEQVLAHYEAQRQILGIHEYSGAERDFVDDIAWNGILEEVIVTPTQLVNGGATSWTAQATDGARRVTTGHDLLRRTTGESPAVFQRVWMDPSTGTRRLREVDAATVRRLHDEASFPRAELPLMPSSGTDAAIERWRQTIDGNDFVEIFQRVRTFRGLLVLSAKPNGLGEPAHQVLLEDVRARHIEGAQPKPWDDAAVRAQIAIGAVEGLHRDGALTDEQRDVALGNAAVPFRDRGRGTTPYRNGLVAIASLAGLLTVSAHEKAMNHHLRLNHQWPHPTKRARAAADQILVAVEREDHPRADQIASALAKLLDNPRVYRTKEHPDHADHTWPDLVDLDLDQLVEQAKEDLANPLPNNNPKVDVFRAPRRALGVLGGFALIVNPALVDHEYPDGNKGAQLSQSGRGGRLRYSGPHLPEDADEAWVGSADPSSVIAAMLKHPDGIAELAVAIRALTGPAPEEPRHPDTGELMDDAYLRYRWLGGGEEREPLDEAPLDRYHRLVAAFMDHLVRAQDGTREIREFTDDDEAASQLFYEHGLTPEQIAEGKEVLADLQEFIIEAGFVRRSREG